MIQEEKALLLQMSFTRAWSTTGKSSWWLILSADLSTKVQDFYIAFWNSMIVTWGKKKPQSQQITKFWKGCLNVSLIEQIFSKHIKSFNILLYASTLGCSTKGIGLHSTSRSLGLEISLSAYFFLFLYSKCGSGILFQAVQKISSVFSHHLLPSARNMSAVMP